jgi:linoleoyl-CoA desaturase
MVKQKVVFQKERSSFEKDLLKKVGAYFKQGGITRKANGAFYLKGGLLLALSLGAYAALYLVPPTFIWISLSYILLGFFSVVTVFNLGHDAMHGAVSRNSRVNQLLGYTWNLVGMSSYIWKLRHNLAHHSFTNVPGTDHDVAQSALVRLDPSSPIKPLHRYQHFYLPFLFTLLTINLVFIKDFQMLREKRFGNKVVEHSRSQVLRIVLLKVFYLTYALILPLIFIDAAWWIILLGFLFKHAVAGIFASAVLVPAHFNPESHFPLPDRQGVIHSSWFAHQFEVTVDFSANTPLVSWLTGGLNYHIAHHLFPNVCHIHYGPLTRIIRQTAKEHHKTYINKSWGKLIYDCLVFAKDLGQHKESAKYLNVG